MLISTGYIRNLLAPADTLKFAQLIGAFAHEFGHAAQLTLPCSGSVLSGGSYRVSNRKAISVLSGVALELHADFMAGWCVGRLGTLSDEQMDAFTDHSFDLGDELYWSPAHHGTPRDRTTMVNTGFNFATRGGQIDFRFGPQDKPDFYRSDPLGASLAGAYTLFTMGKVAPDLLLED